MQTKTPENLGKLARFKLWVHAHPARTYIVIGLGLIIAANLTILAIFWQQPQPKEVATVKKPVEVAEKPKPVYYSPLTGEVIKTETETTTPVTAIIIENSPDARPQSGLKDAEVVYEAVAEGGITRFLALYQQKKPELIGPVRSLRMYYLDWVTPYDASIAHVGGSYRSLQKVRNGQYRDIDQFFNAGTYWRATDRYAPHNVYTNFSRLDQLNKQKGYTSSKPVGLERIEEESTELEKVKDQEITKSVDKKATPKQKATNVTVAISSSTYNSSYAYNAKTKLYARSQAGAAHLDREKGQISARVVIALRVDMTKVLEDGYRESITTTGKGESMIFQNGEVIKATWHKDSEKGQLYFTDSTGERIQLVAGTTWISAVPTSGGDVTWQ
jgi:hypothetical protein